MTIAEMNRTSNNNYICNNKTKIKPTNPTIHDAALRLGAYTPLAHRAQDLHFARARVSADARGEVACEKEMEI
jgi:hypothetical protein